MNVYIYNFCMHLKLFLTFEKNNGRSKCQLPKLDLTEGRNIELCVTSQVTSPFHLVSL